MDFTKMVKMDIIFDCHRLQSKFQSPKMYNNVYSFSDFFTSNKSGSTTNYIGNLYMTFLWHMENIQTT